MGAVFCERNQEMPYLLCDGCAGSTPTALADLTVHLGPDAARQCGACACRPCACASAVLAEEAMVSLADPPQVHISFRKLMSPFDGGDVASESRPPPPSIGATAAQPIRTLRCSYQFTCGLIELPSSAPSCQPQVAGTAAVIDFCRLLRRIRSMTSSWTMYLTWRAVSAASGGPCRSSTERMSGVPPLCRLSHEAWRCNASFVASSTAA